MTLDGYIACICEGSAEQAIMEILLENEKLIFGIDDLLYGKIIRSRSAKSFESEYLKKGFKEKITVIRILDSRTEKFKLSRLYRKKIEVINVITAPEIEMLIIFNEKKYDKYKKSRKKPSEFCKEDLKMSKVKQYVFVKSYFSDINKLINSIKEYIRVSKIATGEYTLLDLLK